MKQNTSSIQNAPKTAAQGSCGVIAIAGRPNAGKSTLMNRVVGARLSIVTPKAQTTRDRLLGILTDSQGQVVFVDTPGIHRAKEGGINDYMMAEVREAMQGVDAVWCLVDPSSTLKREQVVLELLASGLDSGTPVFLALNKADLKHGEFAPAKALAFEAELRVRATELGLKIANPEPLPLSARTGKGVRALVDASRALLPRGPLLYPDAEQLSDRPTRFFVGEMIREQLLLRLGEELPYSCAVEVTSFQESSAPPRIEAVIHVERDSQKGMVVGKGGAKIKEIGQGARAAIEEFLGVPVFLGLRVKLLKDWSRDSELLRRLGYNLPAPTKASGKASSRSAGAPSGKSRIKAAAKPPKEAEK
jgi:GTP-binding protein Era